LVGVFVVAYIIDFLAGKFGARKNLDNAMKVSACAPTATWVARRVQHHPGVGLPRDTRGVYSLYLLSTGIAALMKPAADRAVSYTIAVIVSAIIVWIVIFGITAMLFGVM
jgi:Yip1-like protein